MPTLEYLCSQVKRLVGEYLEIKQKLYDKVKKQIQKDDDYFGCENNSADRSNGELGEGGKKVDKNRRAKSVAN